jgi:hypothetical protein
MFVDNPEPLAMFVVGVALVVILIAVLSLILILASLRGRKGEEEPRNTSEYEDGEE